MLSHHTRSGCSFGSQTQEKTTESLYRGSVDAAETRDYTLCRINNDDVYTM